MTNNNQQNNKRPEVNFLDTLTDLDPVMLGFNISGSDIAYFVELLLEEQGIHNPMIHVEAIKEGSIEPKLGIVLMLERNNRDIIRNGDSVDRGDVLPAIYNRIETGGLRASEKLEKAISIIRLEKKTKVFRAERNKNYVYIPLDPIRILAIMLKVDRHTSKVNVLNVAQIKGEVISTVIKQRKNASINPNSGNSDIVGSEIARHYRN